MLLRSRPASPDDLSSVLQRFQTWVATQKQPSVEKVFADLPKLTPEELEAVAIELRADPHRSLTESEMHAITQSASAEAAEEKIPRPEPARATDPAAAVLEETERAKVAKPRKPIASSPVTVATTVARGPVQKGKRPAKVQEIRKDLPGLTAPQPVKKTAARSRRAMDTAAGGPSTFEQSLAAYLKTNAEEENRSYASRLRRARDVMDATLEAQSFESLIRPKKPVTSTGRKAEKSDNRLVSVNVRVTKAEHARMKAGAAQAGVPTASYLRQCTLEIEALRERLAVAIQDMKESSESALAPMPAASVKALPSPGIISRLRVALLGRRSIAAMDS